MRTTRQYLFVAGLILILAVFNQCKNRSQGDSLMRTIDNNNQFITHVEKEYFINGGLKAVYEINNGKKNGQYIEYYQDSTLKYKQYYHNDSLNGLSLTYMNGRVLERCNYVNGKKDGYYQYYWYNDSLWFEGFYSENEMTGTWLLYDTCQRIKMIECRYPDTNYYLDIEKFHVEKKYDSVFNVNYYMPDNWSVISDTREEYELVYQVKEDSEEYPMFYRIQTTDKLQEYSLIELLDNIYYDVRNEFDFEELYFTNINQDSTAGIIICKIKQYETSYVYVMNVYKIQNWTIAIMSSFPTASYVPVMSFFEFINKKVVYEIVENNDY